MPKFLEGINAKARPMMQTCLPRPTSFVAAISIFLTVLAIHPAPTPGQASTVSDDAAPPVRVLLITSDDLAEAWQPFADWKTRQGKPTEIVTIPKIEANYPGEDTQEKIRNCVQEYIVNRETRWVILGGDSGGRKNVVPDRDTRHDQFRYTDIPADVYYLSSKNWDTNGDSVYGHWADDREDIDYGGENVSIGRIPVRSAEDVASYTAKVIAYESNYPTDGFSQSMVYTCPVPQAYPKLGTSQQQVGNVWSGSVDSFFSNQTAWDKKRPGDYALSPGNWVEKFNEKSIGKWHIHGHGLWNVWVLEDHQTVGFETIDRLANDSAYPVMTSVSCFTGHFDKRRDPCITEAILRKAGGGAIAVMAPAREGVPVFADRNDMVKMVTEGKMDGTTRLLTDFWVIGLSERVTIGEAFAAAKRKMAPEAARHAGFHWVLSEINLLGDPTLDIRSGNVRNIAATHPGSISTGAQALTIKCDAPGATLCLWKADEVYETVEVDSNGKATIEIAPETTGVIQMTLCGPDLNTWTADITVESL